jgi:hypothetical protein
MIEARAQIRLADEYDDAQGRGEVATARDGKLGRSGAERPKPTVTDIGLTRKQAHGDRGAARCGTSPGRRRLFGMSKTATIGTEDRRRSVWPLLIAIVVAVIGVSALLFFDHRRSLDPRMHRYTTTQAAAKAVGAQVAPTPEPSLEPVAPGPKRVDPAVPENKN